MAFRAGSTAEPTATVISTTPTPPSVLPSNESTPKSMFWMRRVVANAPTRPTTDLLLVFAKGAKENLTRAEENELRKLAKALEEEG